MDGVTVIYNLKMMLYIITFVVLPLCVGVLGVFAFEFGKFITSRK